LAQIKPAFDEIASLTKLRRQWRKTRD